MKAMVRPARENDIPAIKALADTCFGKGYLSQNEINLNRTLISELDNRLLGFLIFNFLKPMEIGLQDGNHGKEVAVIKTIAVDPDGHGKGIGKSLSEAAIGILSKKNREIFTIVWKRKNSPASEKLPESLGMSKFSEIRNFWYDDSLSKKYNCPECGSPPCRCTAIIYRLQVS